MVRSQKPCAIRLHQPMVRSQKPQLPTSPWPLALDTAAVPSICSLAPKPGAWAAGRRLHRLMGIDHIWLHQPTAAIVFVLLREAASAAPVWCAGCSSPPHARVRSSVETNSNANAYGAASQPFPHCHAQPASSIGLPASYRGDR